MRFKNGAGLQFQPEVLCINFYTCIAAPIKSRLDRGRLIASGWLATDFTSDSFMTVSGHYSGLTLFHYCCSMLKTQIGYLAKMSFFAFVCPYSLPP
jgi:hypothetical protein